MIGPGFAVGIETGLLVPILVVVAIALGVGFLFGLAVGVNFWA